MKKLVGTWSFDAGGSFGPDVISYAEDGTYTSNLVDQVHDLNGKELDSYNISGTWKVITYRPQWNLFWDEPEYALLCVGDHGGASLNGLSFDGEGYGVTGGEGGGGYVPADPAQLEDLDYVGYNEFDTNG